MQYDSLAAESREHSPVGEGEIWQGCVLADSKRGIGLGQGEIAMDVNAGQIEAERSGGVELHAAQMMEALIGGSGVGGLQSLYTDISRIRSRVMPLTTLPL